MGTRPWIPKDESTLVREVGNSVVSDMGYVCDIHQMFYQADHFHFGSVDAARGVGRSVIHLCQKSKF